MDHCIILGVVGGGGRGKSRMARPKNQRIATLFRVRAYIHSPAPLSPHELADSRGSRGVGGGGGGLRDGGRYCRHLFVHSGTIRHYPYSRLPGDPCGSASEWVESPVLPSPLPPALLLPRSRPDLSPQWVGEAERKVRLLFLDAELEHERRVHRSSGSYRVSRPPRPPS